MYYKHNIVLDYDKNDGEETGFIGFTLINSEDTKLDEDNILHFVPKRLVCCEHATGIIYMKDGEEFYCLGVSKDKNEFIATGLFKGKLLYIRIPMDTVLIRDTVTEL